MRGWRRPALAWLALAVYLLPAPALAQATKAGVVTTLEGNVTAVRAVAPRPVALKFKDDVFVQDRVVTGEQSFARLLLGGKAVVSIRERSAVTITEIPGRSTIDVESGKIALSVARDRMQPGEVINIKMPNVVAGVRGTVVIAEVSYAMVGGAQQAISNLAVLRGQVEAMHTNAAGAAIGTPVMLSAMQKFSATPTTASTGTFTAAQIGGIVQGLQSKGAADPGTASQAPARLEAVNTAVALLTALTGTSGATTVQHLSTGTSPEITTPNDSKPEVKITEAGDVSLSPVFPGTAGLPELLQSPPAPMNMTSLPSGQSLLTFTGNQVQSSDGTPIVPTTDAPLLSRTGFTISQQGADDLIVAKSDANITLPGSLLKLTDTSVQAGDAFFSVAGHVTSTSPQPFIDLDPTTVMAPGNFVEVIGPTAALGLAGTLVKDMGGTVNVGGSVVAVSGGGTLTSTGSGALVQLNGTTMTASSLLSVGTVGDAALVSLAGPLLSALSAPIRVTTGVIGVFNGASVVREPGNPASTRAFIKIDGLVLDSQGHQVPNLDAGEVAVNGATVLDGSVASITGVGGPNATTPAPASLTLKDGGPLLEVSGGAFVNIKGANGNVIRLDAALLDATAPLIDLIGAGTLLQTSNHAVTMNNNATIESRFPAEALVKLENQARMDVLSGHLVNVSASRLNVAGDLVRMNTNTTLNILNGLLLNIVNGGVVNINGALVRFTGNGATINVTNNLLPTTFLAGIPVSIAQGANVSIAAGSLVNLNTTGNIPNGNTIRINNVPLPTGATAATAPGITGSLISVGANGTLRIGAPN
jgi:FecR-like protein